MHPRLLIFCPFRAGREGEEEEEEEEEVEEVEEDEEVEEEEEGTGSYRKLSEFSGVIRTWEITSNL